MKTDVKINIYYKFKDGIVMFLSVKDSSEAHLHRFITSPKRPEYSVLNRVALIAFSRLSENKPDDITEEDDTEKRLNDVI